MRRRIQDRFRPVQRGGPPGVGAGRPREPKRGTAAVMGSISSSADAEATGFKAERPNWTTSNWLRRRSTFRRNSSTRPGGARLSPADREVREFLHPGALRSRLEECVHGGSNLLCGAGKIAGNFKNALRRRMGAQDGFFDRLESSRQRHRVVGGG